MVEVYASLAGMKEVFGVQYSRYFGQPKSEPHLRACGVRECDHTPACK